MAETANRGLSRRSFLRKSAAGAAAAGVLGAAPGLALAANDIRGEPSLDDILTTPSEPLVVYIQDAARGEVVFMTGTREVVRRDRRLVSRLIRSWEV